MLTDVQSAICERSDKSVECVEERIPLTALPKLVWVGAALFTANVLVGIGMWVTPNRTTDPYGREVTHDSSYTKPSPFTEVVDTTRHRVRLAAKVRPASIVASPENTDAYAASLDVPLSAGALDMPVTTERHQQLDIPVRTAAAVYPSGGP